MPKVNPDRIEAKKNFLNLAFRDKKKAAEILRKQAEQMENCNSVADMVDILSETLFISTSYVYKLYE